MVYTSSSRVPAGRYPELTDRRRTKVIKVSGDLRLASMKARKRLGSEMSSEQRRAQIKYDRWEAGRRRVEMRKRLNEALARLPTSSQLALPRQLIGPVPVKALILLGDELLEELSLRQLPIGARVTPKVLKVFGTEPALMSPKARSLIIGNTDQVIAEPQQAVKRRRLSQGTWAENAFESAKTSFESAKLALVPAVF